MTQEEIFQALTDKASVQFVANAIFGAPRPTVTPSALPHTGDKPDWQFYEFMAQDAIGAVMTILLTKGAEHV